MRYGNVWRYVYYDRTRGKQKSNRHYFLDGFAHSQCCSYSCQNCCECHKDGQLSGDWVWKIVCCFTGCGCHCKSIPQKGYILKRITESLACYAGTDWMIVDTDVFLREMKSLKFSEQGEPCHAEWVFERNHDSECPHLFGVSLIDGRVLCNHCKLYLGEGHSFRRKNNYIWISAPIISTLPVLMHRVQSKCGFEKADSYPIH